MKIDDLSLGGLELGEVRLEKPCLFLKNDSDEA